MRHLSKESFNTACLFYLLISAPIWSKLLLPHISTELSALFLSLSLFASTTIFTYSTRPLLSSRPSLTLLATNCLLAGLTMHTLLGAAPISLIATAAQQAALFLITQAVWHKTTLRSAIATKPSYYATVSHAEQKKVNECINVFLPYLIEKKGLFPDDFYKKSYKRTPQIIQNPTITTETASGRQDILETPRKNRPSRPHDAQLTQSTRKKLANLEEFKQKVHQKSVYLQNLNQAMQRLIQNPQLTKLQHLSSQNLSHLTLQATQQISAPIQQAIYHLPRETSTSSSLAHNHDGNCAFSGLTPNVPITISLRNHHEKGANIETICTDLLTFAEILNQFCDKIRFQKGETAKIEDCATHLTKHGRQDLGLKLQKLAQIQQVHAEKSNVIYKCIQFWPAESHELIENLLQFGVECGTKSKNQKTCLQLAQELQLTKTIPILQKHDSNNCTSPAMKSNFVVHSAQPHRWPKMEKSLLDPDIEVIDISLNVHKLYTNLQNFSKKLSTPTKSPSRNQSPSTSPFNSNKLQQQSLYNNSNLTENLHTPHPIR